MIYQIAVLHSLPSYYQTVPHQLEKRLFFQDLQELSFEYLPGIFQKHPLCPHQKCFANHGHPNIEHLFLGYFFNLSDNRKADTALLSCRHL